MKTTKNISIKMAGILRDSFFAISTICNFINKTINKKPIVIFTIGLMLSACQLPKQDISESHIQLPAPAITPSPPPPIVRSLIPPTLSSNERRQLETFNIVVKDVDLRDLLFSLARDAKLNVDISPEVKGAVTINARNQTLPQILDRLSANFDLAYEYIDGVYRITPDRPVLRSYRIEYPNITRTSTSSTNISSIQSTSGGSGSTEVTTKSNNEFWATLIQNIKDILRETDKEVISRRLVSETSQITNKVASGLPNNQQNTPDTNARQATSNTANRDEIDILYAANVIANPETGVMQVRATFRQHTKIQEFLDLVLQSSRRQVLIEATVAEVSLSQKYEKGIDWRIFSNLASASAGFINFGTGLQGANTISALNDGGINALEIGLQNTGRNNFLSSIRLLEEFGNVKVLSSPQLSVLNNQTSLLKVTDDHVFFTVESTITEATPTSAEKRTFTSTMQSKPVGFVMSVTPFIGQDGMVQLNLRPSISRIIDYVNDPAPALAGQNIKNLIPVVRTREIESIMRVANGNIAVLGGLMEDYIYGDLGGLPGITRTAGIGEVLGNQKQERNKTELVIFIRPTIINNADINADYHNYRQYLITNEEFQSGHPALGR